MRITAGRVAAGLTMVGLLVQPGAARSAAPAAPTVPTAPTVPASPAGPAGPAATSVTLDLGQAGQGDIPRHFVGFSVEWSLIERYMGPRARPTFTRLLANLGSGVLRIGGASQDVMPFEPAAPNTDRVITRADLNAIRATLDGTGSSWGVVLGTAMSPPTATKRFVGPDHARGFVRQGVEPAFAGAEHAIAGIELGNEPDLSYRADLDRYLGDLTTYSAADVTGPFPVIAPNTSEEILPWQDIDQRTAPTRFFWAWPRILDANAAVTRERAGAFGAYASDHFYPLARSCRNTPYRCPSIGALLSDEHLASFDYLAYTHAREAARQGLGYRLEETNTAAGRGADGVSNVAASAAYGLDLMFHAACPLPPDEPGANAACGTGAIGVNFHNAEVRAFFAPEDGNGYYNAINYDPTPAMGAPTPAPLYYAALLFGRFAQGGTGLRPVAVAAAPGEPGEPAAAVKAWRLESGPAERRLFLINKGDRPATLAVSVPAAAARVDRMTPYDPTGGGRALDAPRVRVDDAEVDASGAWPGFRPSYVAIKDYTMEIVVGAGEAAVITVQGRTPD
jgi:hypothetical protein